MADHLLVSDQARQADRETRRSASGITLELWPTIRAGRSSRTRPPIPRLLMLAPIAAPVVAFAIVPVFHGFSVPATSVWANYALLAGALLGACMWSLGYLLRARVRVSYAGIELVDWRGSSRRIDGTTVTAIVALGLRPPGSRTPQTRLIVVLGSGRCVGTRIGADEPQAVATTLGVPLTDRTGGAITPREASTYYPGSMPMIYNHYVASMLLTAAVVCLLELMALNLPRLVG